MNRNRAFLIILLILLSDVTLVAQTSTMEIAIRPAAGKRVTISGFNGFRADTLASLALDPSGQGKITIPYCRFILLVLQDGRIFPVILDKQKTRIVIDDYARNPQFAGDEENTFLYSVLTSNQEILSKKSAIKEGSAFFQEKDPFHPILEEESDSLEAAKTQLEKKIWDRKSGLAGLLLQGKSLIESTSGITTREQLDDRKKTFLRFIRTHLDDLEHTDMIRQMAFQYEMMNEYISWGKFPYEQVMVDDVGTWIDSLGNRLDAHEITRYFLEFYLQRSMVSMAIRVADQHLPYSLCPAVKNSGTDTLPDMEVKMSGNRKVAGNLDGISTGYKILFLYNAGCSACIAEQVSLMRILKQGVPPVAVITVFSSADEEKGLSILTRLQREAFLYAVSDPVFLSVQLDYFPAFLVVSGDGKIENTFYTMADLKKWIATVKNTTE